MFRRTGDAVMPLAAHLEELRARLIVSLAAVLVTTAAAFVLADPVIAVLKAPGGPTSAHLYVFSPLDGFLVKWRIALLTGLALASPMWIYEALAFVLPGLTERERRVMLPLIGVGFVLFAVGVAFGYYLLFGMIGVLIALFGSQLSYFPSADAFISFELFFLLALGLAFELPVLLFALVQLGILNIELLRKQRRYFYFAMFVFAEVITPVSDPIIAPLTITAPLILLYELTLLVAARARTRHSADLVEEQAGS